MGAPIPAIRDDARRGWQALDAALAAIEQLASTDLSAKEFAERLAAPLASLGFAPIALWIRGDDQHPELLASSLTDESVLLGEQYLAAASQALDTGAARTLDDGLLPSADSSNAGRPSFIAPWKIGGSVDGAIQTWVEKGSSIGSNYLHFLEATAELVALHRARQRQQAEQRLRTRYDQLARFTEQLHASLELNEVAYRLANDGRVLLGCDRVAVAIRRGNKLKLAAISGAEHVHRRSEVVGPLETLCSRVALADESLWYDGTELDLPPQLTEALASYLEVSPALALAVIPLVEPGNADEPATIAALVCEQYDRPFAASVRALTDGIGRHAAVALQNARLLRAVPARRLWLSLAQQDRWPAWLTRTSLALGLVAVAVIGLFLVPAEIRIRAPGELQPASRHEVFAPRDGVITEVLTDHGETVSQKEDVIVMRSPDLDLELKRVIGELETTRKQLAATQAERLQLRPGDSDARLRQRRLSAEEEQYQEQIRGLESRRELLEEQERQLTLRSPVAGDVLTWNARQRLAARPVRRGDALLTIADPDGPWQLELRVPSRLAGRVIDAQRDRQVPADVSFVLTANPDRRLRGEISRINERMEIDANGESYLLVTVNVSPEQITSRKPGAKALARIHCGRGSLAEAWFHELLDAVRLWLA